MKKILLKTCLFVMALAPFSDVTAMKQEPKVPATCDQACQTEECKTEEHKSDVDSIWSFVDRTPQGKLFFLKRRLCIQLAYFDFNEEPTNIGIGGILSCDEKEVGIVNFVLQKTDRGFLARWFFTDKDGRSLRSKFSMKCKGQFSIETVTGLISRHFIGGFLDIMTSLNRSTPISKELCPICQEALASPAGKESHCLERCYLSCFHCLHSKCFDDLIKHMGGQILGGHVQCPLCRTKIETDYDYLMVSETTEDF